MRRFFKILFVLAGIFLIGLAGFLYAKQGPSSAKISRPAGSLSGMEAGEHVIVKGKLTWNGETQDDMFLFTADSPALIRSVEMVQWYRNVNDEVYLTLSDKKLPDFEHEGKTYANPDFPTHIVGKVFSSGVKADGIPLSDASVAQLSGGSNMILSSAVATTAIEDLPLETGEKYGLAKYDGFYATPGEDWALGDIVVSFRYVDPSFYDTVTVFGTVTEDGKLDITGDGRTWDKDMSDEEIDAVIRTDLTREMIISAAAGLVFILCAFVFFRRKG